jgi:hypothetical protein
MNQATQQSGAVKLLDHLKTTLQLKNDAALARKFGVAPPVVSKIRHGALPVGDSFLIKSHEIGGVSFTQLRTFVPVVTP